MSLYPLPLYATRQVETPVLTHRSLTSISRLRWFLAEGLPVELFLVFANKAEADIIFRDEWDEDVREHASFHCYRVLEQPPKGRSQGTGRITEDILRGHLPPSEPDTVIFLCGPSPMSDALEASLKAISHSE